MTIPPELLRSVPRQVDLTAAGRAALFVAGSLAAAAVGLGGLTYALEVGPIWLPPVAGAGLLALALTLGLSVRRQCELVASGRPAVARVIAARRHVHHGAAEHFDVTVEFGLLNGASRTASIRQRRPLSPGADVIVLYDPERPARLVAYPLQLARCARNG